jgi:putative hydrolases of HD superfamily
MQPKTEKTSPAERLERQIQFIVEIDKLKTVIRRTYLMDGQRRENTAEHSWHIAVMAMLLAEYANQPVDVPRVVKMALIHDIVEIDAGDTFIYDAKGATDKVERERAAADRLFALLPADQEAEFRALWDEFEERQTPESRFAASLDRFIPQLHNYNTKGGSWKEHGIPYDQVYAKNLSMREGSEQLWQYAVGVLDKAVAECYLTKTV